MGRPGPELDPATPLPPRFAPSGGDKIGGYAGSAPRGDLRPPEGPAADVPASAPPRLPEVRYHQIGDLIVQTRDRGELSVPMVLCLRCGVPVVAMETARHDFSHIVEAGGHIEEWALIDRPLSI